MTWEILLILAIIIVVVILALKIFKFVMKVTFFAAVLLVFLKMVGVL
jgi:hypothetical protein